MENRTALAELNKLIHLLRDDSYKFSGPITEEEVQLAEWELVFRFPPSFYAFLRNWGSGRGPTSRILGLHAAELSDDLVVANLVFSAFMNVRYLKFAEDGAGTSFYFDKFEMTPDGECSVVSIGSGAERTFVAGSFLQFLRGWCPAAAEAGGAATKSLSRPVLHRTYSINGGDPREVDAGMSIPASP